MDTSRKNNLSPSTSFFDDFLTKNQYHSTSSNDAKGIAPKANILETDDEFRVEIVASGLNEEDFQLQIDHSALIVQSVASSNDCKTQSYTHKEFEYRPFKRGFCLSSSMDSDLIGAIYKKVFSI